MKIITKTILYYLLISLPLLFISAIFSYFIIEYELTENMNEILLRDKSKIVNEIKTSKVPIKNQINFNDQTSIEIVKSGVNKSKFYDTLIYDNWENEKVRHRVYESYLSFKNKKYKISISKVMVMEHELMESLFSAFIVIIIFLSLGFLLANWLISKTLWKPFYKTLENLNHFDINTSKKLNFEPLKTKEFDQLNESLNKMTDKIYSDFFKQKEFTENASHEMQTPLAVIRANISLLVQSENLKEEEMNQVQVIENSLKKLNTLNKGLILLTKIENNQFKNNQGINAVEAISRIVSNFNEAISMKNLKFTTNFDSDLILEMSPILADILFTNLIQNSIRHTDMGGEILISLIEKKFTISNSGDELKIDKDDLFKRFKKNDASKDSLGLGLSIVKSIVDKYSFEITYSFKTSIHSFIILF